MKETLYTIHQLLNLPLPSEGERSILTFFADSRLVIPGGLFFALPGERHDGHAFLSEVAQKGAVAAVVSLGYEGPSHGLVLLRVSSPLAALQRLAHERLKETKPLIVAITGSVGKTTTKEFVATLLQNKYRVAKSPGNANSQIGLPLGILNLKEEADLLILEMGMSQPGEIAKLLEIAPPDIAIITKIGSAHVSYFSDGLEGIRREKGSILTHSKTVCGIIPGGERFSGAACAQITVGREASCDYWHELTPNGLSIWEQGKASPAFQLPFQAHHLQENFVTAVACARKFGLSWEEIQERASLLAPFQKRFERIERDGVIWINDAYNANPESMRAALLNLPAAKRKIAVLGAMADMGDLSRSAHQSIAEYALIATDLLLCIGDGTQPMCERFLEAGRFAQFFTSFTELKEFCLQLVKKGDLVLLKGSNFNGLWRLLE